MNLSYCTVNALLAHEIVARLAVTSACAFELNSILLTLLYSEQLINGT